METYGVPLKHVICYLVKINDFYIAIDAGWSGHIRHLYSCDGEYAQE